jgi:hypothetical protein
MMKKILVVLLVLATAAGVFAQQGEWTIGGMAEVSTKLNFDPAKGVPLGDGSSRKAEIGAAPFNSWEDLRGVLNLAYRQDGLKVALDFNAKRSNSDLYGAIEYYGDKYALTASIPIHNLLRTWGAGTYTTNSEAWIDVDGDGKYTNGTDYLVKDQVSLSGLGTNANIDKLWGYYKFINGIVHLEAAYKSRGNDWWLSNNVGAIAHKYAGYSTGTDQVFKGAFRDYANSWGGVDGNNFLLANVELSNFNFGIKIPDVFSNSNKFLVTGRNYPAQADTDGIINRSVVGFKFGVELFDFAAQFTLQDYGVYFGGGVNLGPVKAGLSFSGILGEKDDATGENLGLKMRVGGDVKYSSDMFGIGIAAFLASQKFNATNTSLSRIGVEPQFSINVIPTHLRFETDIGFYFNSAKVDGTKNDNALIAVFGEDASIIWGVRPALYWNFLGTGAGGFGGTGIGIKYTVLSGKLGGTGTVGPEKTNELQIGFRWSFF